MGATYTRQSSYADGDVIQAADTNDEFNQLLAAFAASTGHTHDGTTAEGGPITKLLGTAITIGDGTSGADIAVTFDGETNDGVLTWKEDEDYFEFSDDILMGSTEKIQFGDTASFIQQSSNGVLRIDGEVTIDLNASTAVTVSNDLKLDSDAAVLGFGADNDVTLTHVADTGLLLNSTSVIQFNDASQNIGAPNATTLDINATDEVEINATLIDVNGNLDVSGTITVGSAALSEAELEILDGATVTTAELNIMDGDTTASSTTVVDADRVVFNDDGTMKQVAVTDLAAYFDDEITAMPNLVTTAATTVGALNSGSITSGFGAIDTGSSTITTTGLISGGSLDIDDVLINGTTIGHTDDTDLITLANGVVTVAGEVSMTTLDIGGTNVTSTAAELNILDGVTSTATELNILDGVTSTTAELNILDGVTSTTAELNIMDGDTSASSTTVADADRVVFNDNGTMKQVAVTDLAAYFDDEITAMPNLVSTGALNSGSITSGFGTIDTGSSTITTTGLISGGSLDIDDVLINGATIGHTDDTDLITLANGVVTVAGEVSMTTLDIGGTNVTSTAAELNILDGVTSTAAELNILDGVTSTAAELNILDGVTSTAAELNIMDGDTTASSTTVADADRVVLNDDGTMKQVAVTDLAAYFDDEITAMPNLVTTAATTVGALDSGSITSGFGTIDTGSSTITTTGLISGGSLDIDDVLINGTTIGHTDDTDLITLANGAATIAGDLTVNSSVISPLVDVADASGTNQAGTALTIQGGAGTGTGAAGKIFLKTAQAGSSGSSVNSHATQMTIGGSGIGIGVETPSAQLHIQGDDTSNQVIIENTSDSADGAPDLLLKRNSASPADNDEVGQIIFQGRNDNSQFPSLAHIRVTYLDVTDTTEDAAMQFRLMTGGSNSEVMRIEGGTLLVAQTANDSGVAGHIFNANGTAFHVRDGGLPFVLNRLTDNGDIAAFRKDGTTVGSLGVDSGGFYVDGEASHAGLRFKGGAVTPRLNGAQANNTVGLGNASERFSDLYLGNDIAHLDNAGNARLLYDKSSNLLGNAGTNVTCATLSKSSGSFKIDHPLESKSDTHHLVHSFVEAPQADNIYRGTVDLVGGSATINLDTEAGMTEGTFVALNREVQCFTSNESGWTLVKGSVSGNALTITAQDNTCTDTISWLVIGERKDAHMLNTDWTDDNGKVIVEPLKPVDEDTSTSSETTDEGTSTSSETTDEGSSTSSDGDE